MLEYCALMVNKDALWKGIIEDLVVDFVHFFFADFVATIDFEKGFDFLDKELSQLSPQSEAKHRHADSLFKAWLKNGKEHWFLIHVEVQGYPDPDFAKRMYQYAYRIRDRFDKPITALAIYTDSNPTYHFTQYQESFMGTEVIYRFHTYILINQDPSELRQTNNPFGLVMEVAYRELEHREKEDKQRLNFATELVRHLLNQGIEKFKIKQLLDFITCYVRFEQDEFFNKFEQEIQIITKSRQDMGIREAILHDVRQTGFEEGQAQGIEKGIEEGIEKGIEKVVKRAWQKGLGAETIADLADISLEKAHSLIQKFMEEPEEVMPIVSKEEPTPTPSINVLELGEEKRIAIIHAWERNLPIAEIAALSGLSAEEVKVVVQQEKK